MLNRFDKACIAVGAFIGLCLGAGYAAALLAVAWL